MFVFFFFKQRTAYEMRISDWSSDVCSSDLRAACRWRPSRGCCRCRNSPTATATAPPDPAPPAGDWTATPLSAIDGERRHALGRVRGAEEGRGGEEGVSKCRTRGSLLHEINKQDIKTFEQHIHESKIT